MSQYQQMFDHVRDRAVIDGQVYVRVNIISEICVAIDDIIREAMAVEGDPTKLLRGAGMLEFSQELRLQLAKLNA